MKLLKFWAEWCGPCLVLNPIIKEIAEEEGLILEEINIDDPVGRDVAESFGVFSIPTLILVKKDTEIKFVGVAPKARIKQELGLGS